MTSEYFAQDYAIQYLVNSFQGGYQKSNINQTETEQQDNSSALVMAISQGLINTTY